MRSIGREAIKKTVIDHAISQGYTVRMLSEIITVKCKNRRLLAMITLHDSETSICWFNDRAYMDAVVTRVSMRDYLLAELPIVCADKRGGVCEMCEMSRCRCAVHKKMMKEVDRKTIAWLKGAPRGTICADVVRRIASILIAQSTTFPRE